MGIRHLGLLRQRMAIVLGNYKILIEIISRSAKNHLRQKLRTEGSCKSNFEVIAIILKWLNIFTQSNIEDDKSRDWKFMHNEVLLRFGPCSLTAVETNQFVSNLFLEKISRLKKIRDS